MAKVVIIDTESKEAKRLVDYLKTLKFAQVLEENSEEASKYNPDFIKLIQEREKQSSVKLNLDDLWK